MSEQESQKKIELVLGLRFPEFRDAGGWQERALSSVARITHRPKPSRKSTWPPFTRN